MRAALGESEVSKLVFELGLYWPALDLKSLWPGLGLPAKLEAKHSQFHSLATSTAGVL